MGVVSGSDHEMSPNTVKGKLQCVEQWMRRGDLWSSLYFAALTNQ